MIARPLLFAMLGAIVLTSACQRTTSVGAAGRRPDAAIDGDAAMDAEAGDEPVDASADAATPGAEELCLQSGGTLTTASCCLSAPASFPDTCAIGACSCAPGSSRTIPTCACPGGCFSPEVGCTTR
jgi:hypothetical protein